ncbi:IS1182 family transposase [Streptomyces coeruleorubidus]|uniref:IS1182 family transposase n=1 Tax=Streptomyces coeruleorubidus TaxID=116188 RepID=A0ABZ0KFK0_STRC4|nr:IS1182 family transposase [Streptomyces coeruleorubidus]WOT36774.1 IS1182 family transposase [Streptomyces coeruleorubidus]
MSLHARKIDEVPEETARVARAAFPKGSLAMRIRDELGELFLDADFAGLYPNRGKPAWAPGRLALVSVMQFAEGLSDRRAADAVRGRLDWKYLLGLELADPGFDHSVLTEFRDRLIAGDAGMQLLDRVLEVAVERGLLKAGGRARTDSTIVLSAARQINGLVRLGETLRAALNTVAAHEPEWLAGWVPSEWFDRYAIRFEDTRLPKGKVKQTELIEQIGADGLRLLAALHGPDAAPSLRLLPQVQTLRQMWVQQYFVDDGQVRRRDLKDRPPGAERLVTPYDTDARGSVKRGTFWDGYKVHLTETCEPDSPNLITHVATTDSTVQDVRLVGPVHAHLAKCDLLPDRHLVDAGYATAREVVTARQNHNVNLVGPILASTSWQAKDGGFSQAEFAIDWENRQVTCPNGATSSRWAEDRSQEGAAVVRARFPTAACRPCSAREQCTRSNSKWDMGRRITLRPQAEYEVIQQARAQEETQEWKEQYAHRAGVEGTISQGVRAFGLRRCRYHGLAKARLQHQLTATAMNFHRLNAWWTDTPRARTRVSRLAALRPTGRCAS